MKSARWWITLVVAWTGCTSLGEPAPSRHELEGVCAGDASSFGCAGALASDELDDQSYCRRTCIMALGDGTCGLYFGACAESGEPPSCEELRVACVAAGHECEHVECGEGLLVQRYDGWSRQTCRSRGPSGICEAFFGVIGTPGEPAPTCQTLREACDGAAEPCPELHCGAIVQDEGLVERAPHDATAWVRSTCARRDETGECEVRVEAIGDAGKPAPSCHDLGRQCIVEGLACPELRCESPLVNDGVVEELSSDPTILVRATCTARDEGGACVERVAAIGERGGPAPSCPELRRLCVDGDEVCPELRCGLESCLFTCAGDRSECDALYGACAPSAEELDCEALHQGCVESGVPAVQCDWLRSGC